MELSNLFMLIQDHFKFTMSKQFHVVKIIDFLNFILEQDYGNPRLIYNKIIKFY